MFVLVSGCISRNEICTETCCTVEGAFGPNWPVLTPPKLIFSGNWKVVRKRHPMHSNYIYSSGFSYLTKRGSLFYSQYPASGDVVNELLNESNFEPTEGFMMQLANLVFDHRNRNHLQHTFELKRSQKGYCVSFVTISPGGQEWLLKVTKIKGEFCFHAKAISKLSKHAALLR